MESDLNQGETKTNETAAQSQSSVAGQLGNISGPCRQRTWEEMSLEEAVERMREEVRYLRREVTDLKNGLGKRMRRMALYLCRSRTARTTAARVGTSTTRSSNMDKDDLVKRLRFHLSCYTKCGETEPNPTSPELELIREAADALSRSRDEATVVPGFLRKRIEQAIEDALHPKGMSTHSGIAKVHAADIQYLFAVIAKLAAAHGEKP